MMVLRSCSRLIHGFGTLVRYYLTSWNRLNRKLYFSQKRYHIWSEHSLRFCDLYFHDSDSYDYMHISFYLSFLLWRRFQQDRFSDFWEPDRVSSSFTSLSSGISSFPFPMAFPISVLTTLHEFSYNTSLLFGRSFSSYQPVLFSSEWYSLYQVTAAALLQ